MKLLFAIICLSVSLVSNAQSEAITSAGENISKNGKIVSWTIGSTITGVSQTQDKRIYTGNIHPIYQIFYDQKGNSIPLNCFPNPAKDYFNVELHTNEYEGMRWVLYCNKGKKIKEGKLESNNIEIRISNLSASNYFLNIYNSHNESVSHAKLLKK